MNIEIEKIIKMLVWQIAFGNDPEGAIKKAEKELVELFKEFSSNF